MNIKNVSLAIAMAATILLSSCDDNKKSSKYTSSDDSKKSEKTDGEKSALPRAEEALYGKWILESVNDENLTFGDNYFILENDGTGELNLPYEYNSIKWKVDNKSLCIKVKKNSCGSFEIDGDQLTWNATIDGEEMNFKLRKAPVTEPVAPEMEMGMTEEPDPDMGMFEESATPQMDMYSDYDESATEAIAPAEDMYGDMPLEMMEAEEMDIESLDGY